MGIFDFLKSEPYKDSALGAFERARGRWKGSIKLSADAVVPLLLSGGRGAPDEASLALARTLPEKYADLCKEIQTHLFQHYEPYKEAVDAGELEGAQSFAMVQGPGDVWPYTQLERVLIEPMNSVHTVEIAYRVAWDEEHTVGAWIRDWHVIELCGSVGP